MTNSCSYNRTVIAAPPAFLYEKCLSIGRNWIDAIKLNENGRWCRAKRDCELNQLWANLEIMPAPGQASQTPAAEPALPPQQSIIQLQDVLLLLPALQASLQQP